MTHYAGGGLAGVLHGKPIQFQDLQKMWLISQHSYIMNDIGTVCWAHTGRHICTSCWSSCWTVSSGVEINERGGAFHFCPPLPRYTNTWDVNIVLL